MVFIFFFGNKLNQQNGFVFIIVFWVLKLDLTYRKIKVLQF